MNTSKRASRGEPEGRSATWVATVRPQRTSKTSACERPSGERDCPTSRDSHYAGAGALRQNQRVANPIASISAESPSSSLKG